MAGAMLTPARGSAGAITTPAGFCAGAAAGRPIRLRFPSGGGHPRPQHGDSGHRQCWPVSAIPRIVPARSKSWSTKQGDEEERLYEEYKVTIQKPYELKVAKGRDGGTYIDAIQPGGAANRTGQFEVGDKVLAASSVFGVEIWPAATYGQTMYCIRQRIGPLYMKMERRLGKWDGAGDLTEKEIIRSERNSGVVSSRVREIQLQNYTRKMGQKMQREADLRTGLNLYKQGKYEEALDKFETVLGSKPEPGEAAIASYNVACSYSKLGQLQAGLSALEDAPNFKFDSRTYAAVVVVGP